MTRNYIVSTDILTQHLQALKMRDYDPSLFIMSLSELKLDQDTTFEWQSVFQGTSKLPEHNKL